MLKLFSLIKRFLRGEPEKRPKGGPMVGQGVPMVTREGFKIMGPPLGNWSDPPLVPMMKTCEEQLANSYFSDVMNGHFNPCKIGLKSTGVDFHYSDLSIFTH